MRLDGCSWGVHERLSRIYFKGTAREHCRLGAQGSTPHNALCESAALCKSAGRWRMCARSKPLYNNRSPREARGRWSHGGRSSCSWSSSSVGNGGLPRRWRSLCEAPPCRVGRGWAGRGCLPTAPCSLTKRDGRRVEPELRLARCQTLELRLAQCQTKVSRVAAGRVASLGKKERARERAR